MIPAIWAVASASPLGRSRRRRAVSADIVTVARARARRRESGLSPTSTMRTCPDSSMCESSLTNELRRAPFCYPRAKEVPLGTPLGVPHTVSLAPHSLRVGNAFVTNLKLLPARGDPTPAAASVLSGGRRLHARNRVVEITQLGLDPRRDVVLPHVGADRVQPSLPLRLVHLECLVNRLRLPAHVERVDRERE